jgi:hypothetical protein
VLRKSYWRRTDLSMRVLHVLTVLVGLVPIVAGWAGEEDVGDLEAGGLLALRQLLTILSAHSCLTYHNNNQIL